MAANRAAYLPITGWGSFQHLDQALITANWAGRPSRADIMTIDDVDHLQQRIAGTRADRRSQFDLPRVPDFARNSQSPFFAVAFSLAALTAVALLLMTNCRAGAAAQTIPRTQS